MCRGILRRSFLRPVENNATHHAFSIPCLEARLFLRIPLKARCSHSDFSAALRELMSSLAIAGNGF